MVFKRRDRRPIWQIVFEIIYPRGGWARAFNYVTHRVRRLPDTPEKISRGIWAGVFICFTPLFLLHFVGAAIIAKIMRGNLLASLLATFFGNFFTFPIIAAISLRLGHWMLGERYRPQSWHYLWDEITGALSELWRNFLAVFTVADAHWGNLKLFYDEIFFPYLVGGIIPGVATATLAYYISVPLIRAYQNRRRKVLRNKLAQLKKNIETDVADQ
ncbi:MAG: hypothetical protein ACI86S_002459 [Paracoccaceae bacterium]